jgi:hypothetical protein
MAVNFGLLQPAQPASAFFQGQQDVQREAEQNMLRQQQAEQMQFQRENMLAQRQAQAEQRQERNLLAQQRGAQETRAAQTAEIDREIRTVDLASRLLYGATPETYPAIRERLSALNPQFGAGLPPEYNEAQIKALAMQGRSVKEQIEAALGRQQYMSTPYGPFDVTTGEFKMPQTLPARAPTVGAPAPTPAAPKAPVGYRFTDSGNLEAIPGGPATRGPAARGGAAPTAPGAKPPTPAQAAKSERMAEARQAMSQEIENQLGYYEQLADMGAMTSPGRSPVANITAYARSSGLGQEAERALATEAQTLRDNIKNTRQRLFMQIKDATGATASQMNSNVEMQAWLDSMTNPQQSIETVRETLKQMDAVIAGVRRQVDRDRAPKDAPQKPAPAPTAAAPAAPVKRREIAPGVFVTERP